MTTEAAMNGTSTRRNRDTEILDAAISVFSKRGYSGASLQEIADRVGILKGSLYHYITSKESLLFRIMSELHREAEEMQVEIDKLDLPVEEKFLTYVERLARWYLIHRERTSLYQSEWRYLEGDFGQEVRAQRRRFAAYMQAIVQEAVSAGLAPADTEVDVATKFVLSAIDSIPGWRLSPDATDVDQAGRSITRLAYATVFAKPVD